MNEMIVSEYRRGITDVTRDIREETGQFLLTALKIGKLLFEAKAMVEPGGWTKYIEEELPFSHSWANNYMNLYKAYGDDQLSIFGNSQAFMNLRPTQALALLAVPAEERAEFVEQNDVENMSTRELQKAIRERDEARKALTESENKLFDVETELDDAKDDLEQAKNRANEAETENKELRAQAERAKKAQTSAEAEVKKLKKKLAAAEAQARKAAEDAKKAAENPQVPDDLMEQMRAEITAEEAKKAAAGLQKELEAAQKNVDAANRAREEAERKLADSQKQAIMANPDVAVFQAQLQRLQSDLLLLKDTVEKIWRTDAATADQLMNVLRQWLDKSRGEVA